MTLASSLGSEIALTLLNGDWRSWSPPLVPRAQELARLVAHADPEQLIRAVDRAGRAALDRTLAGIEAYRRHPHRRTLADPPAIWREGATRILDYGLLPGAEAGGVPLLVVPSLVNRSTVLDLSAEQSLLRWLAGRGVRPYLVDWGLPGPLERRFTLTDYIAGRLERALDAIHERVGGPVDLAGYCMGGNLALALALRCPAAVRRLVLMATPWDFHADDPASARRVAALCAPWMSAFDLWGEMPVDALQVVFASLDPLLAPRKFARFAGLEPDGPEARAFVVLEDWLNDGVPLAAPVARECLMGWYGENDPARGNWLVAGGPVDPRRLDCSTLVIVPARDRIVPPASAQALAAAIPGSQVLTPPLGHIGMVVGSQAQASVWQPLADWLARA